MKQLIIIVIIIFSGNILMAQKVEFKKSTLDIKELVAYDNSDTTVPKEITITSSAAISGVTIQLVTVESNHPLTKYVFPTPGKAIPVNLISGDTQIPIDITTAASSDKSTHLVFQVSYTNAAGVAQLVKDTLFIKNTYPSVSKATEDYTPWSDGKRAEIFIGTNFDFFGTTKLTDWYGGVRVFLPAITDLKFSDETAKANKFPHWGFYGGVYHSRSFSNFGNGAPEEYKDATLKFIGLYDTVINNRPETWTIRRVDSINIKPKVEIDNWGAYFSPMWQFSRYKSTDGNFITNIYLGAHSEVIRRNYSSTYAFDTTVTKYDTIRRTPIKPLPISSKAVQYDAYFGLSLPIQFLWKDIMDLKITPCLGYGSPGGPGIGNWFYFFQFDLLARLGGLRLNLGGEVRGYFPNNPPLFTAYIGTSFSIQKIADFVTKQ